jgi:hypothetical protein
MAKLLALFSVNDNLPACWLRANGMFRALEKQLHRSKNCERKLENTLNMFKLAIVSLLLKRFWTGS